jgi:DNA-binding LacI/PurR family transcriptional regulator
MQRENHVTIRDVASNARVSTATVSRVISGDGYVSAATREKVERSINKLGYSPSFAAQSLRTKKSTVIGLVITDIKNPFYPELVSGIENEAQSRGYSLILCNSQEDEERESAYLEYLSSHRTDGILICVPGMANRQRDKLKNFKGPIVLLNENKKDADFSTITTNDFIGGVQIGRHLNDSGYKRTVYVGVEREVKDGIPRFAGVKEGFQREVEYINSIGPLSNAEEIATLILKKVRTPFAVVAHNDMNAIALMHEFMKRGFSIPEDIGIVGYDDIAISSLVNPGLTTVNQNLRKLAELGLNTLERLLAGGKREKELEVLPELVERESTVKRKQEKKGAK